MYPKGENVPQHLVAVVGAGPAGLYAAKQLAEANTYVVLFNRDIKPGGLAEYGIYPAKTRMKEDLRRQFREILCMDGVEYYGNVTIGEQADFSLDDLRVLGFQAQLITVGAQRNKRMGIPGEDLTGVYHAKDIVYHYNLMPPYSETPYPMGKRVAVIGAGNVMMDITRWLLTEKGVEEVVVVARRGPAEVKFDGKELENVVAHLDQTALAAELERVQPVMQKAGQDTHDFLALIQQAAAQGQLATHDAKLAFRFFSTPARILSDSAGRVSALMVEENTLVVDEDGSRRARGSGMVSTLDVNTVIFAIGDAVDGSIGLPMKHGEFAKNPHPSYPVSGVSYEAYDPQQGAAIPDTFLAGWARRASTGLVDTARKDGINAAQAVSAYLQTQPPVSEQIMNTVRDYLYQLRHPVIDNNDLQMLEMVERDRARDLGLESFKFGSNQPVLKILGLYQDISRR